MSEKGACGAWIMHEGPCALHEGHDGPHDIPVVGKGAVRYYSELDYPLGPPPDQQYGVGPEGEPIQLLRDTRMWASVEWLAEHGYAVPENWRDLS